MEINAGAMLLLAEKCLSSQGIKPNNFLQNKVKFPLFDLYVESYA